MRRGTASSSFVVRCLMFAAMGVATCTGARAAEFERVAIYLERNVQDRDIEVRFEVTGNDEGLSALRVTAPDERAVIDFRTPASKFGIRHLILESPEPANDGRLQDDFPAGSYRFEGTTTGGATLRGEATLSHKLPPPAVLTMPQPRQKGIAPTGVILRWTAPDDLAGGVVVLEHDGSGQELRVNLAGDVRSLAVPDGFLRAGQKYTLAIGTIARDGNRTFIETEFSTASAP